jgi:hypothetical protein
MEPDEYRRRSLAYAAAAAVYVRTLFQLLPADIDITAWRRFITIIYPTVMDARLQTFNTAVDYYNSQRPADAPPIDYVERSYPPERLQKALEPARQKAVDEAAAITTEHTMAAGREAVEDAVKNDPAALAWARVPSGAETCAFCTLLVSRGPVYKTRQSASLGYEGEPYHPGCDCVPVPVFDRENWPGRDRYLEADALYREVTAGRKGRDALNALRRHLYATAS